MIGFKSFAERTKLEFGPGIIAIVGPNGCGKSNIVDAIRWVLGEQSARALRGTGMTDFIFNGTETHRPAGMAEVSLTLAECDRDLPLGFHEVTITRRVYRSGEGEYLINRTPCRLKDIQRLFLDTGIGTHAYSLMEQGRIDLILSSRPEDRREVFEEASGISRFKADRREALRKLEQTENNLLRLADILREVRRQIISLQRQAGKARRYQALQERLKAFELYFARRRSEALAAELTSLETRRAAFAEREEALHTAVQDLEHQIEALRDRMTALERTTEEIREMAASVKAERGHMLDLVAHHEQRVTELQRWMTTLTAERDDARARAAALQTELQHLEQELGRAAERRTQADAHLQVQAAEARQLDAEFAQASQQLHRLRAELIELDQRIARCTNELSELDAREKADVVRRERLRVEEQQLQQVLQQIEEQRATWAERLAKERAALQQVDAEVATWADQQRRLSVALRAAQSEMTNLERERATLATRLEMFCDPDAVTQGFSAGARDVLSGTVADPAAQVVGALADCISVAREYRVALEIAMRPWADAVVVATAEGARLLLDRLSRERRGPARLLAPPRQPVAVTPDPGHPNAHPLANLVHCEPSLRPLVDSLLAGMYVVADLPHDSEPPAGVTWITSDGRSVRGAGVWEWWNPDYADTHPMARRHQLDDLRSRSASLDEQLQATRVQVEDLSAQLKSTESQLADARRRLEVARMAVAMTEGEGAVLARQANETRQRVETVRAELELLGGDDRSVQSARETALAELAAARQRQSEIRSELAVQTDRLRALEERRVALAHTVTEARIAAADARREVETLERRRSELAERIRELEHRASEREEQWQDAQQKLEDSARAAAAARDSLQPLEDEERLHQSRLEATRRERDQVAEEIRQHEQQLRQARADLDEVRRQRSELDVVVAELRTRQQSLLDRVTSDHRVTIEEIQSAVRPEGDDVPAEDHLDAWEAVVAEMRARLDSMGPVNLVAIEEYKELEQRLSFLSAQQDDLLKSKQQLLDLIRRINQTSTEMFRTTFEQVNAKFGETFARLFHGGTAKLVLVDEGDVLESGIEIIARPPGKKLQSVSLLSGGERTMTAVALLFALYAIKPSPFCVLDEIDAALDESNIGRFIGLLREYLDRSQFIVITHNRQTIAAANTIYGVTMEQRGVSKIMSMRFRDNPESPVLQGPTAAADSAPTPTGLDAVSAPEAGS